MQKNITIQSKFAFGWMRYSAPFIEALSNRFNIKRVSQTSQMSDLWSHLDYEMKV